MIGLAGLLRWAVLRALRQPSTWILLGVFCALWCVVAVLSPVGLTTRTAAREPLVYELAFMGALAGTVLALDAAGAARWWFGLVDPARRFGLRWALLLAGGAFGALAGAWCPAAGLGRLPAPSVVWMPSALGIAHLSALGLWIDRVNEPRALRSAALPLLAWFLPALVGSGSTLGGLFSGLTNAARHFEPDRSVLLHPLELLPIAGLLAGAALLDLGYSGGAPDGPRGSQPLPPPHRSSNA